MCGLVGAIIKGNSGFYGDQEKSFFEMLYADALRGMDSTGVIGVNRSGDFFIAKQAQQAAAVIPQIKELDWYKSHMTSLKAEGKIWLGHNRKTTIGKTNDANAHPFVINNEFAFMHNGTLFNHEKLAKTDVDSKALAIVLHEAMGKKDWKTSLEETLGGVYGAYACTWYDQRFHKLFLLRNKERPLSIFETPNAFYYASEPAMAWWILTRNNYKDADCKHIQIPEHTLVEFNVEGTTTKMITTELSPKKSWAPVVIKEPGPSTMSFGGTTVPSNRPPTWTKAQLKNFTKAHEGSIMRFWVDDYVEEDMSKTIAEGATKVLLLGENEDILIKHQCRALIDLKKLGMENATGEELTSRMWTGTCSWVQYLKDERTMVLNITGCKPIVNSVTFRPKQTKAPFPTNPYKATSTDMASKAILDRVAKLKDQYEGIGYTVIQRVSTDGRPQLINSLNNEVLYESPIALH